MFPYTQVYFSPLAYWPRKCKCLLLPISVLLPGEEGGGEGRGRRGEEQTVCSGPSELWTSIYGGQVDNWTGGRQD